MPSYLYKCEECGYEFEVTGSFDCVFNYRPPCPECKKERAKRKFTTPYIIFKGKGFYVNDKKEQ